MSCRLDYLFKLFPQRLSLADCRQHFVTIIRKGQRWQEFNGQIRVIEQCRVWQYFWNLKQKTVFINDQQHSELFSLNYLGFFLLKVHIQLQKCSREFLQQLPVSLQALSLKREWLLTIPSCAPWNIWKNTSNIFLPPPLFPCYVSHHVGVREAARRRQHGRLMLRGDSCSPAQRSPWIQGGSDFLRRLQHVYTKSYTSFSSATTLQLCLIRREKREWRAQGLWKVHLFSKRPRCHPFFSLQKHSCLGQYCIMHADPLPWRMITNSYLHS